MKKWLSVLQLLPAGIVALAAVFGFQSTVPALEAVVWPERPAYEAQAEEDAAALAAPGEADPLQAPAPGDAAEGTQTGTGSYEDGVYTGSGTGYSGTTTVRVTVQNAQITAIDVTAHADKNPFWSKALGVIDRILKAQTWQVDTVSGATYSSRGILEAVKNALTGSNERSAQPKKQKQPKKTPTEQFDDKQKLKDGVWTGSARGFGGTIKVKVTVKGGKMTKIEVTSHSGESDSYFNKAKKIIPRMLKKGSPNVDTISGATYSSKGIREAVKKALKKAAGAKKTGDESEEDEPDESEEEEEKPLPTGTPKDGTWSGKGACKTFGYSVTLRAVFRDGKLTKLKDFKLVDNEDRRNTAYANRAWSELSETLLTRQDGTVDTVSGATYSSNAILEAYRDAYAKAVKGENPEEDSSGESEDEQPETGDGSQSGDGSDADSSASGDASEGSGDTSGDTSGDGSGDDSGDTSGDSSSPAYTMKDGSYTVKVKCEPDEWEDFRTYTLTVEATFESDKLTGFKITGASDTSNSSFYDLALKGSGKTKGIAQQLKAKNSDSGVDAVSGATCSSKALVSAYREAVKQAKEAAK